MLVAALAAVHRVGECRRAPFELAAEFGGGGLLGLGSAIMGKDVEDEAIVSTLNVTATTQSARVGDGKVKLMATTPAEDLPRGVQ